MCNGKLHIMDYNLGITTGRTRKQFWLGMYCQPSAIGLGLKLLTNTTMSLHLRQRFYSLKIQDQESLGLLHSLKDGDGATQTVAQYVSTQSSIIQVLLHYSQHQQIL